MVRYSKRYITGFEHVSRAFRPRQRHSLNLPLQWVNGTINENFKILTALFVFFTRLLLCRQHAATITIRALHTRLIETKRSFSITVPRR